MKMPLDVALRLIAKGKRVPGYALTRLRKKRLVNIRGHEENTVVRLSLAGAALLEARAPNHG